MATKTIVEPARELKVMAETDVLVVGGGPAGLGAAILAARNGASTILMERYGHLGGLATGGLVITLGAYYDSAGVHVIRGLSEEIFDRLEKYPGGVLRPTKEILRSKDKALVDYWRRYGCADEQGVAYGPVIDAEIMKHLANVMVRAAGVKLLLHSWGAAAAVESDKVKGVIFESKAGRQAVLAKVVVDCTGDGDIFASAGVAQATESQMGMGVQCLMGGVDLPKVSAYFDRNPAELVEFRKTVKEGGIMLHPVLTTLRDVVAFNSWINGYSAIDVEDLTYIEVKAREDIFLALDFLRKNAPGFENAYVALTAPQIGTRASRRLAGEYVITMADLESRASFPDVVAKLPNVDVPYRALVPATVDGLLAAGRCISVEEKGVAHIRLIGWTMAMGEAAGAAAALAVKRDVAPREVKVAELQETLVANGVYLG